MELEVIRISSGTDSTNGILLELDRTANIEKVNGI